MATLLFGPLVTGARGTVAGTILSANKSGPYARGWARGPNPMTSAQTAQRRITSAMSEAWRQLSQVQRDAWDVWAALPAQDKTNSLGVTYSASGFNWYVAINTRLTVVGRAVRIAPPAAARPAAPSAVAAVFYKTGHASDSFVAWTSGQFVGFDLVLYVAIANSPGVLNLYRGWRLTLVSQAPGATAETIQDECEAIFGTLYLGQRGFARIARQTTDGLRSSWSTAYSDIA